MAPSTTSNLVHEKCVIKEVTFKNVDCFFSEKLLEVVEKTWDQWLGSLVSVLPPYKHVINQLHEQIVVLLRH